MTALPGTDIRGFYTHLGIDLPAWARGENVCIRCVFDTDAHNHHDHNPSLSINLVHGSFNCHACAAKGGPYDAATHRGYNERDAMQLLIRYGIAAPRQHRAPARRIAAPTPPPTTPRAAPGSKARRPQAPQVSVEQIHHWQRQLLRHPELLHRLAVTRGWRADTIRELGLGLDHRQITIPVYDDRHQLVSLVRYRPDHPDGLPKIWAARGSHNALFPHPATETSHRLLLVEGEPDAIAARSHGLPAISVPGTDCWQPAWAALFKDRAVTIVFDADAQGRRAAADIAKQLAHHATRVQIADLARHRDDGYDLTDWLIDHDGNQDRTARQPSGTIDPRAAA